jgi:hypothetical protein
MGASTGKLTTKAIAVIVIVAMLDAVGLSPVVMVLVTGVVFVVWMCARRAQAREVERIFDFYIAADAILREEERRWYGFEITEVIEHGESMLEIMPDPPPLNFYTLGALYHRLGNHQATVEYLSRVVEDQLCEESEQHVDEATDVREETSYAPSLPLSAISAPPPITKVLHDVYQDETRMTS